MLRAKCQIVNLGVRVRAQIEESIMKYQKSGKLAQP